MRVSNRTTREPHWSAAVAAAVVGAFAWSAAQDVRAADRAIGVDPVFANHWSWLTPTTPTSQNGLGRNMMAGFWQRSSGAAPGVGSNNVAIVEFQLPETPPARVKSATFQMAGRASQCAGNEPVVFDVYAYAGDGKPEIGDAGAGTRVAQLTADCKDNPAFNRPVDVTALVRQLSVPSGVRYIGFNVRKANNRRLAAYFGFAQAKLTVVVADRDVAVVAPAAAGGAAGTTAGGAAGGAAPGAQTDVVGGLIGAATTLIRGGGQKPARDQARDEAKAALQGAVPAGAPAGAGAGSSDAGAAAAPAAGSTDPAAGGAASGAGATASGAESATGAPAAASGATGAAGAAAVGASKVSADIVGLKLGMSLADVKRALAAHSTTMNVDEQFGIVNNVAATKYLSWVIARNPKGAPAGSSDAIGVHFAPPPNAHRAVFIERFTGFQPKELPLYDTIRAALVKKFGQPSFSQEGMMLWTYDANGTQIVDASTPGRCAKFPPIDPPARGQNVMFNGHRTAGCGVTIYARFDRGTGPADRELTRYLSVSIVDDSQFEAMRQATAKFATQAMRETAGKVAAPKL
jgi:hypothetical protein